MIPQIPFEVAAIDLDLEPMVRPSPRTAGGQGSGNFGHAGRPGEVGGSAPSTGVPVKDDYTMDDASIKDFDEATRFRIEKLQKNVDAMAAKMNFDASRINVVDIDPRTFKLGDKQLNEAGHYSSLTGEIEVNARNTFEPTQKGIIAHEISHAEYDMVKQMVWSVEQSELYALRRDSPEEYSRLFFKKGTPKRGMLPEIEQRFPATAAMAKYRGWGAGPGNIAGPASVGFRGEKAPPLMTQLIADDGTSEYSRKYWENIKERGVETAIDETLAEVTRMELTGVRPEYGDRKPSQAWLDFRKHIVSAYERTRHRQAPILERWKKNARTP